jgi:hypothetical protein
MGTIAVDRHGCVPSMRCARLLHLRGVMARVLRVHLSDMTFSAQVEQFDSGVGVQAVRRQRLGGQLNRLVIAAGPGEVSDFNSRPNADPTPSPTGS